MSKAKNNPKPTVDDRCILCGKPYAHLHEVYGGKNRQNSIEHKLQVRLCLEHHTGEEGVHNRPSLDVSLKQACQVDFEKTHTREEFMQIIGRNYL